MLPTIRTYTEKIRGMFRADAIPYHAGIENEVPPFSWFMQNPENVAKLDRIAEEARGLWRENPAEIDLARLKQLMYEVFLIVYAPTEEQITKLKKDFCIE